MNQNIKFFLDFFKTVYSYFKRFGIFMSHIVNFILLLPVYFIGVGLTSLGGKLAKKNFLDMFPNKKLPTYWKDHAMAKNKKPSRDDLRRMF